MKNAIVIKVFSEIEEENSHQELNKRHWEIRLWSA